MLFFFSREKALPKHTNQAAVKFILKATYPLKLMTYAVKNASMKIFRKEVSVKCRVFRLNKLIK